MAATTTLHRCLPFRPPLHFNSIPNLCTIPGSSSSPPSSRLPVYASHVLDPSSSFCFNCRRLDQMKVTHAGDNVENSKEKLEANNKGEKAKKKIFVAGSTGRTGKWVVEQLLSRGYSVRAGALDLGKARRSLPLDPKMEIVRADVTEGSEKLIEAIGDAEAVICATGDINAPWKVDYSGTVNLVEACRKIGVNRFILVSSILVNGAAIGQILNPAYIILNAFGFVLIAKLKAEQYIRRSGINYTIIRPGSLTDEAPSGNIIMKPEDTLFEGSISRYQVAEVAVEAVLCPESFYKVVEIVARADAPNRIFKDLFAEIPPR